MGLRFLLGLVAGYGIATYLHRNEMSIRLSEIIGDDAPPGGHPAMKGTGEVIDITAMSNGQETVKRLPPQVREKIRQFMLYGFRVTGEKVRNGVKLWLEDRNQQIPIAMKSYDGTYTYDPEELDERLYRASNAFHEELMVQP